MNIKYIGKRCGLCDKTFTLLSSPFTCHGCGHLVHRHCGKREFVADQITSGTLRKASICINCWKEDRTQLMNRRLAAG